jgi:ABC-2 type transport system permease protein
MTATASTPASTADAITGAALADPARSAGRSAPALRPRLGALTAERIFIGRSFVHSVRDVESMLMAVMLPVMLMLMFTWIFGNAIDPSGGYVDYVVPGIILLCAGFGASSTAVSVSRDMTTGVIDRFRTMPIRSGAVLTGHVVASLARNLVATAVVICVGLLVGFRPSATPLDWVGAFAIIALYILAITYLFAAIGLAAKTPEAASGYGFILLFLPYVSSAFVPVSTMPDWLQPIAQNQPITPIIETIRALLTDAPLGQEAWWAIGWCVAIIAAAALWGAWLFRRKAGRR